MTLDVDWAIRELVDTLGWAVWGLARFGFGSIGVMIMAGGGAGAG